MACICVNEIIIIIIIINIIIILLFLVLFLLSLFRFDYFSFRCILQLKFLIVCSQLNKLDLEIGHISYDF